MTIARLTPGALLFAISAPALAQEPTTAQSASPRAEPRERINLTIPPDDEAVYEDCSDEQQAASISGEIIVCRRKNESENRLYDREEAQRRHAEKTAFRSDPKSPDFILDCHEQGWPFGCVRMGDVPPPVAIIDVTALPEAPPGSDAALIAEGARPQ